MNHYKQRVEEYIKKGIAFHVYSEVVANNLILQKKEKYTKRDYDMLRQYGLSHQEARFICLCSAAHYHTQCSSFLEH